jgi:hypothetical protein
VLSTKDETGNKIQLFPPKSTQSSKAFQKISQHSIPSAWCMEQVQGSLLKFTGLESMEYDTDSLIDSFLMTMTIGMVIMTIILQQHPIIFIKGFLGVEHQAKMLTVDSLIQPF